MKMKASETHVLTPFWWLVKEGLGRSATRAKWEHQNAKGADRAAAPLEALRQAVEERTSGGSPYGEPAQTPTSTKKSRSFPEAAKVQAS